MRYDVREHQYNQAASCDEVFERLPILTCNSWCPTVLDYSLNIVGKYFLSSVLAWNLVTWPITNVIAGRMTCTPHALGIARVVFKIVQFCGTRWAWSPMASVQLANGKMALKNSPFSNPASKIDTILDALEICDILMLWKPFPPPPLSLPCLS